ncbi:hypothetical protein GCM10027277_39100 [Pseudoduganella ginsengisoli]|uniref:GPI inositol-deacylase PGAP1-like alpha/beta domain-containing protein n=1 Tax=Pseudoduganella ginsengisoli TaxID=1462440 RepID=A0A6L6PX44_9BURK|nr:hypothetical protein [Pseudoduganella ginsengisoli]MTW02020.1 hypothetical protein [Pseudoduganella ginsengisoli]
MATGQRLPVDVDSGGKKAKGYCTPRQLKQPQVMCVAPNRVLPIVFIPGIMGSHLRMNKARQEKLKKSDNIAWRPDDTGACLELKDATPAQRQAQLDPEATEVDDYDPKLNPTGNPGETADARNKQITNFATLYLGRADSLLLIDDPVTTPNRRTKVQKALERGWGEVYYSSYGVLLRLCEKNFNDPFGDDGNPAGWWRRTILDVPPAKWGAYAQPPLQPLTAEEFKQIMRGCWYPVHAMGYNWLRSNRESGKYIADRVRALIQSYRAKGFKCEKVILVTHSMGGLVARAAVHPEMGGLNEVLGIVHGVMPAIGAGAGYKRIRCGFEGDTDSILRKVLGQKGPDVTCVLANAQGGLELLPSQTYGNGWLQVQHHGTTLFQLPAKGDPYEEIYKVQGKWYQLLNELWINPGGLDGYGMRNTLRLLDKAKTFHQTLAGFYHPVSYAHYGVDTTRRAWKKVVWDLDTHVNSSEIAGLALSDDNAEGQLRLTSPVKKGALAAGVPVLAVQSQAGLPIGATLLPAADPGDQTVPLSSAEDQLHSGKFRGIFRQIGYEHQASYKDENALYSTVYSIVRIAQTMKWS